MFMNTIQPKIFKLMFMYITCVLIGLSSCSDLQPIPMLTWEEMLQRLVTLNEPVTNDERQNKYCEYISLFLSHFGNERCVVVGSTQEGTRLRVRQDEGDYDYLLISEKVIPVEALEYRQDLPCFVKINGKKVAHTFSSDDLLEGKYVPSYFLSELRPEAFGHLRDFHSIITKFSANRDGNVLSVALDHSIKPGKALVIYRGIDHPDFKATKIRTLKDVSKYIHEEVSKKNLNIDGTTKAARVIDEVWKIISKRKDDGERSNMEQNYDDIVFGFANSEDKETNGDLNGKQNMKDIHLLEKLDKNNVGSCSTDGCDDIESIDHYSNFDEGIILEYHSKSSKDFIPVFPLKGRPIFLEVWKNRERNWPSSQVVEDIFNSEFYVVAKPAIINPEIDRDFCLAYNNAEIKLAKAMTSVQRKVILIIKALKKTFLSDYADVITTFHWKTALYWVSETTDSDLLTNKQENVIIFLLAVMEFMKSSLLQQKLFHYLIPSNLFAGMNLEITLHVAEIIDIISSDPKHALNKFFADQSTDKSKFEIIPLSKVVEFKTAYNDPKQKKDVDIILAILQSFSNEDSNVVVTALKHVLQEGFDYLVQDMKRGKEWSDSITPEVETYLGLVSINKESLIERFLIYVKDKFDHGGDISAREIARDFIIVLLKNSLKGSIK